MLTIYRQADFTRDEQFAGLVRRLTDPVISICVILHAITLCELARIVNPNL